jgi:hypothetical protein
VKELTDDRKKLAIRAVHKLQKKNQKSKTKFSEMWKPSSSSSQLLKLPSHNNKPKFPRRFLQKSQHNSRFLAQPRTPPKIPKKLQTQLSSTISSSKLKKKLN